MVGAGGLVVPEQQLGELNKLLTAARAHTAETKARYDQVLELQRKGLDAGSTNEGVGSNTIGRLREQYGAAARLEASLSAKLGPLHPDVRDVHAQARRRCVSSPRRSSASPRPTAPNTSRRSPTRSR